MKFEITPYETCDLVKIHGRIDSYTTPLIEDGLKALLADGRHKFVVDFEDVPYLSSSGMLMLINLQKQCQTHPQGNIFLCNVTDRVLSGLQLAGFDQLLKIFKDCARAIEGF